ncbi:MAG: C-GCAxxG-C-C family protein [Elusimicrobia bacterium]|nr:C-GCAxxG-C-C family protein [Elusimicrobiota bacterium]
MKEKAKNHFLGLNGYKRLNCAMAVAEAFHEKYPLDSKHLEQLKSCGGGRAPAGICGSIFAAKVIMDQYLPGKSGQVLSEFASIAGSVKCGEIRRSKKLSCVRCVELSAEHLLSVLPR